MKYLKVYESFTKSQVDKICQRWRIRNWTLRSDGKVDVDGDVMLWAHNQHLQQLASKMDRLPLNFGRVTGNFSCDFDQSAINLKTLAGAPEIVLGNFLVSGHSRLTTLEGAPESVGGNCTLKKNKLTSLKGCSTKIGLDLSVEQNKLTSLEGCPDEIPGYFYCYGNKLTTLSGSPREVGSFDCKDNKLTSLEGGPQIITKPKGYYNCSNNELTTLLGSPRSTPDIFNCSYNYLTDLVGGPEEVGGSFIFYSNSLISLKGFPKEVGDDIVGSSSIQNIHPLNKLEGKELKFFFREHSDWDVWKKDGSLNMIKYNQLMEWGKEQNLI